MRERLRMHAETIAVVIHRWVNLKGSCRNFGTHVFDKVQGPKYFFPFMYFLAVVDFVADNFYLNVRVNLTEFCNFVLMSVRRATEDRKQYRQWLSNASPTEAHKGRTFNI